MGLIDLIGANRIFESRHACLAAYTSERWKTGLEPTLDAGFGFHELKSKEEADDLILRGAEPCSRQLQSPRHPARPPRFDLYGVSWVNINRFVPSSSEISTCQTPLSIFESIANGSRVSFEVSQKNGTFSRACGTWSPLLSMNGETVIRLQ